MLHIHEALTGLQVKVCQHQLSIGQPRLAGHCKLSCQMSNLGRFLHNDSGSWKADTVSVVALWLVKSSGPEDPEDETSCTEARVEGYVCI